MIAELTLASDHASAQRRLAQLTQHYPLPSGYAWTETFLDRARIAELELSMAGLIATDTAGAAVSGSAAEAGGYPVDRAYFELLERVSLMLARKQERLVVRAGDYVQRGELEVGAVFPPDAEPTLRRLALSNGVALHRSWPEACAAAWAELLERDAVLRSFRGEAVPRRLAWAGSEATRAVDERYTAQAYAFEAHAACACFAAGFFLFPRDAQRDPLAFGFAAARELESALSSAEREALQRLAFLIGEPLPACVPEPSAAPDYHQEYYLHPPQHARLQQWLSGAGGGSGRERTKLDLDAVTFVDLTPEALQGKLYIAKALSPHVVPLMFGQPLTGDPHPVA